VPSSADRRRTTSDTRAEKRARVRAALANPATADLPNRHLARLLSVDESMVRRVRLLLAKELAPKAPARKPRKDAGRVRPRGR
jgi:hypothetical protein